MLFSLALSISVASLANGSVLRRAAVFPTKASNPTDPGMQPIPATGQADNTFNNGAPMLAAEPDKTDQIPPAIYGARDTDLPFGRLYHGNAKFFSAGQLNTPTGIQDKWVPDGLDSANQSACGIPDNAFSISKVAIHPYFLKYADLSRYCMQDVCISFWKEDGSSDMMLKVTDICSTDPNDPTHCVTPADIKIDRTKAQIMEKLTDNPLTSYPQLTGDQYPEQIWWFFTKCWADGLAQPAYQGNNWFTTPALPNNLDWSQETGSQQWLNNNATYASKGWIPYPNGAYNTVRDDTTSPPITDWAPGDPNPSWEPVAGGKGWGGPSHGGAPAKNAAAPSAAASVAPVASSASAAAPGASTSAAVSAQGSDKGSGQGGSRELVSAPVNSTSDASSAQSSGQGSGEGSGQGGSQASASALATSTSTASSAQSSGQGSGQASGQGSGEGSVQGGSQDSASAPATSTSAASSAQGSQGSGEGSGQGESQAAASATSTSTASSAQGSGQGSDQSGGQGAGQGGSPSASASSTTPSSSSSGTSAGNGTLVALWEPCNFPSKGINGPLPCASGSECICKDNTYAQCREQLNGSWTPAGTSWECQKPGDTATGIDEEENCDAES